jgi:hypothetical protein
MHRIDTLYTDYRLDNIEASAQKLNLVLAVAMLVAAVPFVRPQKPAIE